MAYGNIASYEPAESPGAYRFTTNDGRKLLFSGPTAEDLKARLDAANSSLPQPTAQFGPMANIGAALGNGQLPAAPPPSKMDLARFAPNAPEAPNAAPPAPSEEALPKVDYAFGPNEPGEGGGAAAAAPARSGPLAGYDPLGYGLYRDPTGKIVEINYQQARGPTKGGLVERGRTVRGGFEPDQELIDANREYATNEQAARAVGEQGADELAVAQDAMNRRLLVHAENQQKEAQALADETTRRVADLSEKYDKAEKEFSTYKVEENGLFAGGKNWIALLGAGIGTFSASLGKQPNFAMQVINQRISNDIRAQELERATKSENKQSALHKLERELGSRALAKDALRGIQLQKIKQEFEVQAQDGRDKQRQANALTMLNAVDREYTNWKAGYLERARGEVTQSLVNVPGTAGQAGGFYAKPVNDQLTAAKKLQDLEKRDQQSSKVTPRVAERTGTFDAALQGLDEFDFEASKGGYSGVIYSGPGAAEKSQVLASKADAIAPIIAQVTNENPEAVRDRLLSAQGDDIQRYVDNVRRVIKQKRAAYAGVTGQGESIAPETEAAP